MESDRELEAIETDLLLEAIHLRYGYDLRGYEPRSMRRRARAALTRSGLESLGALQHHVLADPRFFAGVLNDLTVHVSEMFRDPPFHRALREHLVPMLRTYPLLKLWVAGCATGEEVYSLAILLLEEGLYDRCQIYATDVSEMAVEQARGGVYRAERLPNFAENHRRSGGTSDFAKYYIEAYGSIAMRESLRRHVVFFHHDLVSDQVFGEMNVVLCRNVFIYFGQALRRQVLAKLAESLRPGGFLCLGTGERLLSAAREMQFVEAVPRQRIYRLDAPAARP